MSSLIFYTEEKQVLVATDTLATSTDGKPAFFTTKAFILPHLKMIIAGTGVAGLLGKWFIQINDKIIVRDIDDLDYHTPNSLATIWAEYMQDFPVSDTFSTTIYHMGFSRETGLIHSYAYRSINNFQSELLSRYGIRLKPECTLLERYELPNDIKKMMIEQRTIQASRPEEERIYIGGEITVHHLTEYGFNVYTLDRFDDYDVVEQAIYKNFHSTHE